MGKPRVRPVILYLKKISLADFFKMIILVRHAQSEGNKNREIHQMVPDHRVKLTPEGQQQVRFTSRTGSTILARDSLTLTTGRRSRPTSPIHAKTR